MNPLVREMLRNAEAEEAKRKVEQQKKKPAKKPKRGAKKKHE